MGWDERDGALRVPRFHANQPNTHPDLSYLCDERLLKPAIMKIASSTFIAILLLFSCKKAEKGPENTVKNFENEVSYTITRTNTGESQEVQGAGITAAFYHNVYPVEVTPNEKDIIFSITPEVPAGVDVVSRFSFEFIFGVPASILDVPNPNNLVTVELNNPEDYPMLLLDNDEENGRRVCLTKQGTDANGNLFVDNACASEGWYGVDGNLEFDITYHDLFYDTDGQPNIYAEGTFKAETGDIHGSTGTFKLSNGAFKVVIPLKME